MYRIKFGQIYLHHPYSDHSASEAKLSEELNTHGSLDMTLDDLQGLALRSTVGVYDDDGLRWRGRVLSIESTLDGMKQVHCEGALSFLCDTVLPPFSFKGTPEALFRAIINNHNTQLGDGDPRRFTIGTITVTDPNDYISRSSESAMSSWEAITSRLIETCGGYVYLSGEYLNVINYVADFDVQSGQTVHFSENLIDLTDSADADGVVTVLYPYGAQFPENIDEGGEQIPNPDYEVLPEPTGTLPFFATWGGNRLTLDDPVPWQAGIYKYGRVYGTATWDDITLAENLETAAEHWLYENYLEHIGALGVSAADLSLIDSTIDKINVGMYVDVVCEPMDISIALLCMRKETDLIDLSQTVISLGKSPTTLTSKAVIK